ncbi:multicopper oxidase domain-containing protein [Paracoccus sp. (in: a-proteobacteria)]|uniref:multicopper oxidase family protein n=1 Tax=Paracoccus sp. TaxID=267 RepID=UPI003340A06E
MAVSRRAAVTGLVALGLGLPAIRSLALPTSRPWLPRPVELASGEILAASRARLPFTAPESRGYGYNQTSPGPLIRVRRGEEFRIRIANHLNEETTFHWHGLICPTEADGQPQNPVLPGESAEVAFPILQRAGLSWYHPHPHGATAKQAWHGLGGFFVIEDEEEKALGLPSGEDEWFLFLRDIQLDALGRIFFPDDAGGSEGTLPLINGVVNPRAHAANRQLRLRILNGANARVFRLSADAPLTLIGNDGGLLETPVPVDQIQMGPAERIDVILDLRKIAPGTVVGLRDDSFAAPLLEITVREGAPDHWQLPKRLSTITPLVHHGSEPDRVFTFQGDSTINDKPFEPTRIDFAIPFGKVERWRFQSAQGAPHPIHIHGAHFQVIQRSGRGRNQVEPWERGWKDTVLKWAPEQVDILVRFDTYEGRYLLHCHKLEHEDGGMMLNFVVGKDPEAALEKARIEALYGPICTTRQG